LLINKLSSKTIEEYNYPDSYVLGNLFLFIIVFTLFSSLIASFFTVPLASYIKETTKNEFSTSFWTWVANIANIASLIVFFDFLVTKLKPRKIVFSFIKKLKDG
jgi:hypothetical protein